MKAPLSFGLLTLLSKADEWTDDFTKCNIYRLVDQVCPEDQKGDGQRFTLIPATQRTNNVPGYALDVTPWATETQLWIKMEAYTPLLPPNSVFEMYTSVKDHWDTSREFYDTVKCTTEYWGSTFENSTVNDFEVGDYQSKSVFYDDVETVGDSKTSVSHLLDTSNGGTSDWWISPFADEAKITCNDYYCTVTCVVYRKLLTTDTKNDV